jgi:formate dehydrogenase iron-sulfur subunit
LAEICRGSGPWDSRRVRAVDFGYAMGSRVGFFTDSSICIGCKACEVACKEWNLVPEDGRGFLGNSYDNTGGLGANAWRHVAFIEQSLPDGMRWLMSSDVCKHCAEAACLEVCPTGAIVRTEFDTVFVQEDVCNGCGYCVPACPFGVIDRRPRDGRAFKCTHCYDRLQADLLPACAKACPTQSISFGPVEEMAAMANARLERLHAEGVREARLYGGDDPGVEGVGGTASIFLLLDRPQVYGLPSAPVTPTRRLDRGWAAAAVAAGALALGVLAAAFAGRRD